MSTATKTKSDSPLDLMFDDVLTPELAERVLAFKLPKRLQDRAAVLFEKSNEGELTPEERREYAKLATEVELVSILQLKARKVAAKGVVV